MWSRAYAGADLLITSQTRMTTGLLIAGRYRLLTKLGQGGMGAVWRAEHLTLGTQVAIKLIDTSIAGSEEALARFRREAQAAAELRSAHVVHILDYGVEDGRPYIAMELLDGESLAQRLERSPRLNPAEVAEVLSQTGRALTKAHQRNIVHRDLKPDNIYLVRDGDEEITKVLDFGIAKKLGLAAASGGVKTQTGAMLGTPYYMSPEQAKAQSNVDHRTDIWSLGIIAYQCLTGVRPFDGDTLTSLLLSICTGPVPVPSSVADVPAGFDAWFARATERNPDQRFQSVTEAITELRRVLGADIRGDAQGGARTSARAGDGARGGIQFESTVEPSALTIGAIPTKSSRTAVLIAVALAALIGLSVLATRSLLHTTTETSENASAKPDVTLANAEAVIPPPAPTAVAAATASVSVVSAPASSAPGPATTPVVSVAAAQRPRRPVAVAKQNVAPASKPVAAAPAASTVPEKPPAPANSTTEPAKPNYYKSVGF